MNNTTDTSKKAKTNRKPSQAQLAQREATRAKWIARGQAFAVGAMIVALALIGFLGSWQNLRDLGAMAGDSTAHFWSTANLTPISVDLMLVIASIQLRRKGISDVSRLIARLCSISGLAASVAGNVLVAWLRLPGGADALQVTYTLIWAAMPVLSLLGAVEMLTHTHKDRPTVAKAVARKSRAAKRETSTTNPKPEAVFTAA